MEGDQDEQKDENIRSFLSQIAGVDFELAIRKPNRRDQAFILFKHMISTLEQINGRAVILEKDHQLNFDDYDSLFYDYIDASLTAQFGEKGREIVLFYLDRFDENGELIPMPLKSGELILLHSVNELWFVLNAIKEGTKPKPKSSHRAIGPRRGSAKENPSGDSGGGPPDDPVESA